jgi:hypothetical protein
MTAIQGNIGMGGLLVLSRNLAFGGFDEITGEFVDYQTFLTDCSAGWNHMTLIFQGYGTKFCAVSLLLNGTLYCQKKAVYFQSNLMYIGNSKQHNEPFFEWKDFRVFERAISHEEFVFYGRKDRIRSQGMDDRVSYHDLVSVIYDEFLEKVSQQIGGVFEKLLASPGHNFISAADLVGQMARNEKFRKLLKESMFTSYFPILFNDIDGSLRRKKALCSLLLILS